MKAGFLAAVSCTALGVIVAPAALAQQADVGASEIIVTGSRISISGYEQPTPVTVVGEELIQRDAKASIGDTIRELPSVGSSASPNNGSGSGNIVAGITGLDTINLRQLGTTRTLVLFDGQRVVQSNITGQIDLGTIPTMLVERIDVVTAGASAAWGSDAVSGVVNLVLNKRFDGLRLSVDAGDSYAFDHRSYRVQAAAGTGFGDGRGRVIAAVNYMDSPDVVYAKQRKWNTYRHLVDNPAWTADNNEPRLIHHDNVGISQGTQGGLITDGPLKGIQFVGNGIPVPYTPGTGKNPVTGGGDTDTLQASLNGLTVRYRTLSAFGLASYELTDWLKASVQVNYGETHSKNNSVPAIRLGNMRIALDNAYLPQSVKDAAAAWNAEVPIWNAAHPDPEDQRQLIANIPFGTTNMNNLSITDNYSPELFEQQLGIPVATTDRTLKRGVFTLEGDLGGDWSWSAYYQYGEVKVHQFTHTNVIGSRYNLAVDAVVDPSTGSIVCRSTLTDPGNGCVPLNVFGVGVASPEAMRYVNAEPGQNFQIQRLSEHVAAVSAQGTLPFGFEAGDVAVALGAEYRAEKGKVDNDQGAKDRIYSVGNFPYFRGSYNVKEAFLEAEVPLLDSSVVDYLSLNAAGRVTDYSTSGSVVTWKVGLTSQLNPDIRLRGTVSRDIRAPNLNELFSSGLSTLSSGVNPYTDVSESFFSYVSGNPDLKPEKATTWSAGIVLTPGFLPRFSFSADYYNINLKDAISTISQAQVLERCKAGDQLFCGQVELEDPITKKIRQVSRFPQNLASMKASGLDFQADYSVPLGAGDLRLRLVGNYIFNLSEDQLGKTIKYAGALSGDNGISGVPKARVTASTTYAQGPLSVTAQARFIGAGKLVYNWTAKDVDDNKVPAILYGDLRGSYQLTDNVQLFGTVDNLWNKAPPNVARGPSQGQSTYYFTGIRGDLHDALGRSYRIGARLNF